MTQTAELTRTRMFTLKRVARVFVQTDGSFIRTGDTLEVGETFEFGTPHIKPYDHRGILALPFESSGQTFWCLVEEMGLGNDDLNYLEKAWVERPGATAQEIVNAPMIFNEIRFRAQVPHN